MKLRYVVIAVDHFANKTSVDAIVNRWNDPDNKYNLGMTIKIWKDEDFIPNFENKIKGIKDVQGDLEATIRLRTRYHRTKQPLFYKECSRHLIDLNKTW